MLSLKKDYYMTKVRWCIFSVIFGLVVINFVDRTALSIAMPLINKEFSLTPTISGIVLSSFFWAYAAAQIPGGWFIDKFGPRKAISFSTLFWGIFQGAASFATGGLTLILTRIGLGFSESPLFPSGAKLNAVWLAKSERARGAVIVDSGAPLGAAVGGIVMSWLIVGLHSWRLAFFVMAIITIVCSLVSWIYLRDAPEQHDKVNENELQYIQNSNIQQNIKDSISQSTKKIKVLTRTLAAILTGRLAWAMVNFGLLTWGPSYFHQSRGFNLKQIGFATFAIFIAGMCGSLFSGFSADFLISRGLKRGFVYKSMICFSGLSAFLGFVCLPYIKNPNSAIFLLCTVLFFLYWGSLYWSLPALLAPKSEVGKFAGTMNFVGSLGGIAVPIIVGLILQISGQYFYVLEFFAVCAAIYALATLLIKFNEEKYI